MEKYIFSCIGVFLFTLYLLVYNSFMVDAYPVYPKYDGHIEFSLKQAYMITTDKENLKDPDYISNTIKAQIDEKVDINSLSLDEEEKFNNLIKNKENIEKDINLIYLEEGLYTFNIPTLSSNVYIDYDLSFANKNITSYNEDYNFVELKKDTISYNIPVVNNMLVINGGYDKYDMSTLNYKQQNRYATYEMNSSSHGFEIIKPEETFKEYDVNSSYAYDTQEKILIPIIKNDETDEGFLIPKDLTLNYNDDDSTYENTSHYTLINFK